MFERYFGRRSEWIPRESLSTRTKRNLRYLERELGYEFEDQALKAQFGHAPSYLIEGTTTQGEEVLYERRETSHRQAGQTYIWVGGKRRSLGDLGVPDLSVAGARREWLEEKSSERIRRGKKRREELLDELLEEADVEGMSEEELGNLRELLGPLVPLPWELVEEDPYKGLTKEEKKGLRGFLEEFKRELES